MMEARRCRDRSGATRITRRLAAMGMMVVCSASAGCAADAGDTVKQADEQYQTEKQVPALPLAVHIDGHVSADVAEAFGGTAGGDISVPGAMAGSTATEIVELPADTVIRADSQDAMSATLMGEAAAALFKAMVSITTVTDGAGVARRTSDEGFLSCWTSGDEAGCTLGGVERASLPFLGEVACLGFDTRFEAGLLATLEQVGAADLFGGISQGGFDHVPLPAYASFGRSIHGDAWTVTLSPGYPTDFERLETLWNVLPEKQLTEAGGGLSHSTDGRVRCSYDTEFGLIECAIDGFVDAAAVDDCP